MNERRITDLIDRSIIDKTEKVFPDEFRLLLTSLNFMRRLTSIADRLVTQYNEQSNLRATMDLFCRNRDLIHFSIVCLVNGGYSETKILIRVAIEHFLLIRLFQQNPLLAEEWFSNPKKFQRKWKPQKIRKSVFKEKPQRIESYAKFYSLLCDYHHGSFKGWIEIMKKRKEKTYILWHPEFNPDYTSECMGLLGWVTIQSISGYITAFQEWLTDDLKSEANRLMPKVHEMVTRHFVVRKYDKKSYSYLLFGK